MRQVSHEEAGVVGVCSWQTTIRGREFLLYETFA